MSTPADRGAPPRDPRARRWALAIVAAYLLVLLAGLGAHGLTDDDDFYVPAGISQAAWLGRALSFGDGAWTRAAIDEAFRSNREHPPLAKYAFGVSHFLFRGLLGPTDSARVGTVLFSTLCAALLLFMAMAQLGDRRGLRVGGLAVLALLTLPRFHFHSHAATLDVPVAAMYLASAAAVLAAERSRRAAFWAGPIFGLANATKLNAPFLLLAYLPFVALTRWGRRDEHRPSGERPGLPLPSLPAALLSMATIGPAVFYAVWPWIWAEPVARIREYIGFHVHHYGIYFLYFGRIFSDRPYAPWHAPFVMAAGTVPLAVSLLALGGLIFALPIVLLRLLEREGPDGPRRREGDLLLFVGLNALTTISIVAFAGTPIYGGAKLFMPFFPFWCLLAGYGASRAWEGLAAGAAPAARAVVTGLVLALVGSGALLQARFGGYALSEYNGLVGGLRGATAIGFERQYYDIAFRDLVAWVSKEGPPRLRVHFLPNNWEYVRTWKWYRQAGELREDIQVVNSEAAADWVIVTHERRFSRYVDDLQRWRGADVIREHRIDGTPIWTVLKRR